MASLTTSADAGKLVLTAELSESDRSAVVKKLSSFEKEEDHVFLEKMVWRVPLIKNITEDQAEALLPFFRNTLREPIYSKIEKGKFAQWEREANTITHKLLTSSDELEHILKTIRSQEDVRKIIVGSDDINWPFKQAIPDGFFGHFGVLLFGKSSSFNTWERTHQYYELQAVDTFDEMQNQACHPDPLVFKCPHMIFQYIDDYGKLLWCKPLKFGDEEPNL